MAAAIARWSADAHLKLTSVSFPECICVDGLQS